MREKTAILCRSFLRRAVDLYESLAWPWDREATIAGARHVLTAALLLGALLSLVLAFLGGGGGLTSADNEKSV